MARKKRPAAAAIAAMGRRHGKRGAASEAAEEAADIALKGRLAKPKPRKRTIPKDITRRGPKKPSKPSKPPKAPPKKGGRPSKGGGMVVVKKDKDGNWVRQPVPKPQNTEGYGVWDPTKPYRPNRGSKRKPPTK